MRYKRPQLVFTQLSHENVVVLGWFSYGRDGGVRRSAAGLRIRRAGTWRNCESFVVLKMISLGIILTYTNQHSDSMGYLGRDYPAW
jgi:hypothetical protein